MEEKGKIHEELSKERLAAEELQRKLAEVGLCNEEATISLQFINHLHRAGTS